MNNRILVLFALLVTFALSGCSKWCTEHCEDSAAPAGEVSQDDPMSPLFHGKPNSRTWVVYDSGGRDSMHLKFGGAFRIEKVGNEYRFVPLRSLLEEWGKDGEEDFFVRLTVIGSEEPYFCGEVEINNHPADAQSMHYLLINSKGPDNIEISYEKFVDGADQCTHRQSHAGMAHAEN